LRAVGKKKNEKTDPGKKTNRNLPSNPSHPLSGKGNDSRELRTSKKSEATTAGPLMLRYSRNPEKSQPKIRSERKIDEVY